MKRMHVMLKVENLENSIRFYSALFDTEPTVHKADYAKWMLEDPRVNFSISDQGSERGIEHLGIQAETPEELTDLRNRIARAGGTVTHEGETTCCYAQSDKSWVMDEQGVSWEAFYTHGVATTFTAAPKEGAPCCHDAS